MFVNEGGEKTCEGGRGKDMYMKDEGIKIWLFLKKVSIKLVWEHSLSKNERLDTWDNKYGE